MNKRQELIDELIKADVDGTYKTYKSTEEIGEIKGFEKSGDTGEWVYKNKYLNLSWQILNFNLLLNVDSVLE